MPYRISQDRGVIQIDVEGEWPVEQGAEAQKEAGTLAREHGIKKILVDLSRSTNIPDTIVIFKFVPTHLTAFPPGTRHAVVYPQSMAGHPNIRFGETVAANNGVQLRAFISRTEALAWLGTDAPSQ